MTPARLNLLSQARAYLDACARDFEAAQERADRARRILEHVKAGKSAGNCPTPKLDETSASAQRFAARVDALLLAVYEEENPSDPDCAE